MQNHQFIQGKHHFHVHGGDTRTSNWLYGLSLGVIFALTSAYIVLDLGQWIHSLYWAGFTLLCVGLIFWYLSDGKTHRYEIQIDPQRKIIYAIDHKTHQQLWEDTFRPERLYRSNIQVVVSGQVYRYPALAYGNEQLELIVDGLPTNHRILLGFGDKEEVDELLNTLKGLPPDSMKNDPFAQDATIANDDTLDEEPIFNANQDATDHENAGETYDLQDETEQNSKEHDNN